MENVVKACLFMRMIFETMPGRYIHTYLTCDIRSRAIYNLQFTPIKWWKHIASHNMKGHVQYMRWVIKYYSHMFTCVGHNHPNGLQNFVISTYIHKISHEHINPVSYHIVRMSHWWANVRMVKSRRIHPLCTIWYYCPITEQICVRKHIGL